MNITEIDFSVLMSVYSKEKPEFFMQAVESVMNNTVKPKEIVIVKDGQLTEELEQICTLLTKKYPQCIRYVPLEKNVGLGLALKKGVLACNYDLIARMDTDDISKKDRFEKQLKMFRSNRDLALCGGYIEEFSVLPQYVESIRRVPTSKNAIYHFAKKRNPFNHMTVMFRKDAVIRAGNYQSFYFLEDYYLWFRMMVNGYNMSNVPEVLVSVRTGNGMLARRGGWQYFQREIKLYKEMRSVHFISLYEYLKILGIRFVSRISPLCIREVIYKKILR